MKMSEGMYTNMELGTVHIGLEFLKCYTTVFLAIRYDLTSKYRFTVYDHSPLSFQK